MEEKDLKNIQDEDQNTVASANQATDQAESGIAEADVPSEAAESADTTEGSDERDIFDSFSFNNSDAENGKKKKDKKANKPGMVKKQIIMIGVFAIVAVILILVYFIVLKPIFDEKSKEEGPEILPLLEGEVRDEGGVSILMFPYVEKKNLQQITVKNPSGGYTLKREKVEGESDPTFIIAEHPGAPLSAEMLSKIIVSNSYSVIVSRIRDDCPEQELKNYGLGAEDNYTTVTVEDISGNKYTYYVGSKITSAGGYYCRYSTRNAVYIINSTSGGVISQSAQSLLSPLLGYAIGSDAATMIDFFALTKNGEDFITFSYDKSVSTQNAKSIYKMSYPGEYLIDSDAITNYVTSTLAALEGSLVIECGDGTADGLLYKNEKLMAQYGFHDMENPAYELFYEAGEYSSYVIFTQAGVDGYYYAYSYIWDTIVLVEASKVPYLEWDLLDYISDSLFLEDIGKVDSIAVSGNIDTAGNLYNINETIKYWKDDEGGLMCKAESTGWIYSGNYSEQNYAQSFFISVAMLRLKGYASEMGFDKSDAQEYARIVITMKDGSTDTYIFYKSGGYCYYELNGEGEFYVLTRQVNKVLIDAVRAANNCPVDWQAEYSEYPSENELLRK